MSARGARYIAKQKGEKHYKLVSGLHTPYNLQVILGKDNIAKANKYAPA